ncbi:peroxide stress protein YaaA [Anaerocolumna jejuensis]|uniref:peroxide stress protein YaaA n=1 Tax=Anaerocolumna jejuensis TaxID=259063 RepID=UPI003F7C187A
MRIIISPAKKMKTDTDTLEYHRLPIFMEDTGILLSRLRELSYEEAKKLWNCNDKIAAFNYERLEKMDLCRNLTPAVLSYEGIQYQYMAPHVFESKELAYINEHLRILSGFYGLLNPFDGVIPYRLEMQARLTVSGCRSLYEFWNKRLAEQLFSESSCIINLASAEYSKCISAYLPEKADYITCIFGELIGGKVVEKGTLVKMARGEMVRFMAENRIEDRKKLREFDRLQFIYSKELSDRNTYVFLKGMK